MSALPAASHPGEPSPAGAPPAIAGGGESAVAPC